MAAGRHLGKFQMAHRHISAMDHPIDFVFDPRVGFSGTADRIDLLPPSWKISNSHISGMGRPVDVVFDPRVGFSGTADRMALFPVSPNPIWWLAAILENFE